MGKILTQVVTLEELKTRVGTHWAPFIYPMEPGLIARYRRAIGDAESDEQGIVPPGLLPTLGFEQVISTMLEMKGIVLHGSTDLECFQPVGIGDTISVGVTITSIRERRSENRDLAFITLEKIYHNQHGQQVARCRQLAIFRQE